MRNPGWPIPSRTAVFAPGIWRLVPIASARIPSVLLRVRLPIDMDKKTRRHGCGKSMIVFAVKTLSFVHLLLRWLHPIQQTACGRLITATPPPRTHPHTNTPPSSNSPTKGLFCLSHDQHALLCSATYGDTVTEFFFTSEHAADSTHHTSSVGVRHTFAVQRYICR